MNSINIRFSVFSLLLLVLTLPHPLLAGDCSKTGTTCVDTTPCKTFSGVSVCLSQLGISCWEYEDSYTCIKPDAVNYCQPFISAQPACQQTNSQCSQSDTLFNTGCMAYTQTWRCSNPLSPSPSNTTKLADTYTLVSSGYDPTPCQSLEGNSNCSIAQSQCVSTTPTSPLPAGIDPAAVAPDGRYQKQNTYACLTGNTDTSDCASFTTDPNCTLQSSGCTVEDQVNGQCTYSTNTYRCMKSPETSTVETDCGAQSYCVSGNCTDVPLAADSDFAGTVAVMEAQRQASVYLDAGSLDVFHGVSSQCSKKLGGLANCCKKNSGGQSNNVLAGFAIGNLATNAGGYLLNKTSNAVGSTYVYDSLFQSDSPDWIVKGFESMFGAGGGAAGGWAPSLNFMGLGVTFGGVAPVGTTVLPSLSSANATVYWNPTAFYWQIGLMLLQEILSCEQDEQILAMKRGSNLCTSIGSYCSSKFLGICLEKKESYCCFNSRLARIINEQGRPQIGRSWGDAKSPDCRGFTTEEISRLDFSQMDLSEFYAEIAPSLPNAADVSSRAATYNIDPLKDKAPVYFK